MENISGNAKKKPKILIVDDDIHVQNMLKSLFDRSGIDSCSCSSAQEAFAILEACSTIKLVLLDISMPEITGIELLEKIQKILPSVHVIMITGLGDLETAKKCMQLGAKDFITKPFDMEYLQTSVLTEILPIL